MNNYITCVDDSIVEDTLISFPLVYCLFFVDWLCKSEYSVHAALIYINILIY